MRISKLLSVLMAALVVGGGAWVFAQTNKPPVTTFTDKRDGQVYRTVRIGSQVWMAENLRYKTGNSKCYGNSPDSCAKYGRLFTWTDAKTACPSGFRLPSDSEWTKLENAVGGSDIAGKKLKSKTDWKWNSDEDKSGNGTDEHGFSALPGGYGNSGGYFDDAGGYGGLWWSATEDNASDAWSRYMYYFYEYVYRSSYDKANLFSVRCVEDAKKGGGK